ncbi:hypothetical protein [Parapontixanthobacter aurantiacus]|nr:hypothetical protein [Parapontixanthobacter aurantiacus]
MSFLTSDLSRKFGFGFLLGGIAVLVTGDFGLSGDAIAQAIATILP